MKKNVDLLIWLFDVYLSICLFDGTLITLIKQIYTDCFSCFLRKGDRKGSPLPFVLSCFLTNSPFSLSDSAPYTKF